jgi:NAD(P)-dependent dehydrogenase (short-subunit alcohol dehydrogenase family)
VPPDSQGLRPGLLSPAPPGITISSPPVPALKRYILKKASLPQRKRLNLPATGEIWISDDGRLARHLASRIDMLGQRSRVVSLKQEPPLPAEGLRGLVIVAPATADDPFLQSAFRLLQLAGPGLRRAGNSGGSMFVTVSFIDGAFGLDDPRTGILSGGLAGLAKTAAHEWPEVQCKAIDLAHGIDPDEAVLAVADELFLSGPIEVGIGPSGRCTLQLVEQAIAESDWAPLLAPGDVVVISGGARGVTAEAAVALARHLQSTLVLLGRSPEPRPEPDWLASLSEESEIKRALAAQAKGHPSPREIGEECRTWLANREMLRNLDRVRAALRSETAPLTPDPSSPERRGEEWRRAGSVSDRSGTAPSPPEVHYFSVDVRDAAAVRLVLNRVRSKLGPIRGVIHGAGVIADRKIEDKTFEHFDAVYSTKVAGLRSLLDAVHADELKVLALFSSSTGRFGRAGQIDYAVANEVLNKMAQHEARRRPGCRVAAINWGPWAGGMVTPALRGIFESEGIGLIPLQGGAEHLVREISTGQDRAVEVVVMGGDGWPPPLADPEPAAAGLVLAIERKLNVEEMPVLRSHVLANRAVMPLAMSIELLAHAALHGNPGLSFHGFDDLRVLKGIRLGEADSTRLRMLAGKAAREELLWRVPVELRTIGSRGREVLHVRGAVLLVNRLPKETVTPPAPVLNPYNRDTTEIYRDLLFHGPDLHGIQKIEGMSPDGLTAWVSTAPPPAGWIKHPLRGTWLADPLVLDSAFQLMCVWSFEQHGAFSLPAYAGRYRQYRRPFPADGVAVRGVIRDRTPHRAVADLWFLDRSGNVVAQMIGYECVIDASLNQAFRRNQLILDPVPSG